MQGAKANGAFILTASHNPGGPTEVGSCSQSCIIHSDILFLLIAQTIKIIEIPMFLVLMDLLHAPY